MRIIRVSGLTNICFSLKRPIDEDHERSSKFFGEDTLPYDFRLIKNDPKNKTVTCNRTTLPYAKVRELLDQLKEKLYQSKRQTEDLNKEVQAVIVSFETLQTEVDNLIKNYENVRIAPILTVIRTLLKLLYGIIATEQAAVQDIKKLNSALLHAESKYMELFTVYGYTEQKLMWL